MPTPDNILISLPLDTLAALIKLPEQVEKISADNKKMRQEVAALRHLYSQLLEKVADLEY